MTVHELVEARAAELGDKKFVLFKEDEVSFGDLAERMRLVAGGLAKLGLGKGDKIALLLPNCLEFLYSFFGAMNLGAVVVPINPLLKEAEVSYIINNSDATAIVTCDRFLQRVLAAGGDGSPAGR